MFSIITLMNSNLSIGKQHWKSNVQTNGTLIIHFTWSVLPFNQKVTYSTLQPIKFLYVILQQLSRFHIAKA